MTDATKGWAPTETGLAAAVSVLRLAETLAVWQERWRQRRHLQQLDDHMLKDIGLSRADVESEIGKPVWRA